VSGPSASLQREEHGPVARLLLILVGVLFILAGAVLVGFALWGLMNKPWKLVAVVMLALFGAILVYGCVLLRRGLEGWSSVGALNEVDARFRNGLSQLTPLVGLVLGVVVWLCTGGRVSWFAPVWYLTVSLAFFPASAAIHELGHLLAGLIQGRTLVALRIWPWTFRRSGAGAFRAAPGLRVVDGIAGFVQWSGSPDRGRTADIVMVAGGPVANIAASAMLVLLGSRLDPVSSGVLIPLLLSWAISNGFMGTQNLLPNWASSTILSDGSRILRMLGPGHPAFRLRERLVGQGFLQRPREWKVSSRELTEERTQDPVDRAWLLLLALSVSLDLDDRPECDRVLRLVASEEGAPSNVSMELVLQRVLIHALLDRDPGAARTELTRLPAASPGYPNLALAATLHAEGQRAEAVRLLDEWKRSADSNSGWIIGNQWAIDRLERELSGEEVRGYREA
jgi:hypothetical protein